LTITREGDGCPVIVWRIAAVLFWWVSLVALAAPAGADSFSPAEQAYLDMLKVYGFDINPEDAAFAVKLGHTTCSLLENGGSPQDVADALWRTAPKFTEKQSANLVSVAQMKLCPDTP
jgi:serine/threonine-protein kinase